MNLIKNKFVLYSLILSFLGFLLATYLTILHYKNVIPPCTVTSGCETVLTSQYAQIGPIPLALLGSLFYLSLVIVCLLIMTNYKKLYLNAFYLLAVTGFIVSVALILIQQFLIHAFCQYCILSEVISTGIVILAALKYKESKKA